MADYLELIDIPKGCEEAHLIYKAVGERKISLTFLPPYEKKYETAPVYIMIPGGGWCVSERQAMIDILAVSHEKLRREGFAVVSIDYRTASEETIVMRDIVTDCFDAARYIAHFADILEVDTNSFSITGHSAGGHLCLMLSYAPQNLFCTENSFEDTFTVRASAPLSAPVSLYIKEGSAGCEYARHLGHLFKHTDSDEERRAMSPDTYINENTPPTILCAGTSDWLVFSGVSEELYDQLLENNLDAELVLSVGGGHLFERMHKSFRQSLAMEDMMTRVADFIIKHK